VARGQAHSPELRAAVIAELLSGSGVNETARKHSIHASIVSRWKREIPAETLQQVEIAKESRIDGLLEDYLVANLGALRVQAEYFADETFIRSQTAAQLLAIHGHLLTKAIRLFEAQAGIQEQESEGTEDSA
jgi:transposase-like protein